MLCSVCGGYVPELAASLKRSPGHEPELLCIRCLVDRYPELAGRLVRYLTEFKRVRPG
ncbi:hypothetical protein ES703_81653 [subsurface metagenome]